MSKKTNNIIIVWTADIIRLLEKKPIGGIAVQMYFWAQVFVDNGWHVYSFAENIREKITCDGINFIPERHIQRVNFLMEWIRSFMYLLILRPKIVIYRGANRHLLPLSLFSKFFDVKLVYFSASDVNFEPGHEMVGSEFNRKLYHRSIPHIRYFVTQNHHQHDTLLQNYGKESLSMFNIWGHVPIAGVDQTPQSDVVWMANFRKLKRAEWVMNAAEQLSEYRFVLAGGRSVGQSDYYDEMERWANKLDNVSFLGGRPFIFTNALVACSRVLLCTSTFEGFPNTFLQAWSAGIPVISTVDPSGIIAAYGLGEVVHSEDELVEALGRVLGNDTYYHQLCRAIKDFFMKNHASQMGYERLINYLKT